jgi:hypothetical protein
MSAARCHRCALKYINANSASFAANGEEKMNRARYRVVQDFLHVVMMGVVTGVLFSMAVTGVVFLISGHTYG